MREDLVGRREHVMARVDRAIDAAWPARAGDEYVREMKWAVAELEAMATLMQAKGFNQVERSRTYRLLGSIYADLEPALGKEMLLKAKTTYQIAETLLENIPDEFERAKLNFNYANTLRQIDPNDFAQLQEAKNRLQKARTYLAVHAPQYLAQVDTALQSVENLLKIAPLANTILRNQAATASLQDQLAAGGNESEIAEKASTIIKRGGGAVGVLGQARTIIGSLIIDKGQSERFAEIQKQMGLLTQKVLGKDKMPAEVKQAWSLLKDRLESEANGNIVSKERTETLEGVLEEFGEVLSADEKDAPSLLAKGQRIKEFIQSRFEMARYLSHGIERPPVGTRAADLLEMSWQIRRFLLEEMNRPEKGEEEGREALALNIRAARVDRRIYEAGADNARAMTVEKDELRPLALAVRNFSARAHTMAARPIWHPANPPVDTNSIFYSGPAKGEALVAMIGSRSGLETMPEPRGESYASARWKQLLKAGTTVFDLRAVPGPDLASVTYELGIALTLGKPVIVLVSENQTMPFDVDINPVVMTDGPEDETMLASAIDRSVVWTFPGVDENSPEHTLEYVLSMFHRPQRNVYADQTLHMLAGLRGAPDPLAIARTVAKLFDYVKDGATMLIQPWWSPVYPEVNAPRLFHVMPFRPWWAEEATSVARAMSEAEGVQYVRGDEVAEPNIIHSIWEEIARATHVLVDLTGFNANVALELGIAHTLGKKVLMVGQVTTAINLFKSIRKLRVKEYDVKKLREDLGVPIRDFMVA